jgi:hypothetical protein
MKCVMTVPTTQYAQRQPDHGADDLVGGAGDVNSKLPDNPQSRPTKLTKRDDRIQQAHRQRHRGAGEQLHVFLDALVGVVRRLALLARVAREFEVIEGAVGHPARHVVARHPGAPAQLQQLRHVELEHLQQDVEEAIQHEEHAHLAPEDGRESLFCSPS